MENRGIEIYRKQITKSTKITFITVDGIIREQITQNKNYQTVHLKNAQPNICGKKIDNIKKEYNLHRVHISKKVIALIADDIINALDGFHD